VRNGPKGKREGGTYSRLHSREKLTDWCRGRRAIFFEVEGERREGRGNRMFGWLARAKKDKPTGQSHWRKTLPAALCVFQREEGRGEKERGFPRG